MSEKPAPKPDDPEQSSGSSKPPREVEAEDDPKVFNRVFKKVAKTSPQQA